MSLTQTALTASFMMRGSVCLLVYPRLRSEPSPKVIWHADGRIAEVISKMGSDFVFVAPKADSDDRDEFLTDDKQLSFRGQAGSAQIRGKRVTLTLGAAGEIRFGDKTLTANRRLPRFMIYSPGLSRFTGSPEGVNALTRDKRFQNPGNSVANGILQVLD